MIIDSINHAPRVLNGFKYFRAIFLYGVGAARQGVNVCLPNYCGHTPANQGIGVFGTVFYADEFQVPNLTAGIKRSYKI